MINYLIQAAEERFGIKADPDDIKKLFSYIGETYNRTDRETIDRVFESGEAADFLTVNETYFFREPAHFSFLWDLLPSFEKTGLRVCCAAVATGCEAYSIAMMMEAYNKSSPKPVPRYHIDAFDINPKVIETANAGIYSARTLREDGSIFRYMADRYLAKTGNEFSADNSRSGKTAHASGFPVDLCGQYRTDPTLKKNIRFFVHNLMNELPAAEYDIVFFRNAFIYFSQRYRERILSNLAAVLGNGGILIMGVSETAGVHHEKLESVNRNDVFYFCKSGINGTCAPAFGSLH